MSIQRYELHRFCKAFRRANAPERGETVASMKHYGYDGEQPITLYEGLILDGATRQNAAEEAGVEPTFATFVGSEDEAVAFVIRRNKARKHMTKGELVLAGARLATAKRGGQPGRPSNNSKLNRSEPSGSTVERKTIAMVAKELGVGAGTMHKGREIIHKGAPNVIAMVEASEIGVSNAADGIRGKTKDEQAQMTAADLRKRDKTYARGVDKKPKRSTAAQPTSKPHVSFAKLDIGDERIFGQPVQLWPAHIQRLQESGIRVAGVAGRVEFLAKVDTKGCAEDLERLLAYQPLVSKKSGEERDFAREARKSLATVEQHIENAINRLVELRDVIASRAKEKGISQMLVEHRLDEGARR